MYCPFCNAHETKVVDSRLVAEGQQIRRRRECITCHERFTTYETAELLMPRLIKAEPTSTRPKQDQTGSRRLSGVPGLRVVLAGSPPIESGAPHLDVQR